jgi:hypothetical protein
MGDEMPVGVRHRAIAAAFSVALAVAVPALTYRPAWAGPVPRGPAAVAEHAVAGPTAGAPGQGNPDGKPRQPNNSPYLLLALVAAIFVTGVGLAIIRAILAQRASRASAT